MSSARGGGWSGSVARGTIVPRVMRDSPLFPDAADAAHEAPPSATIVRLRLGGLALVAAYAVLRLRVAEWWDPLDDLNLAIHEAGHIVFSLLGETMTILGGSLFQVLVPLMFVGHFWRRGQRFAAGVTLAWPATSLLNVSRYIGDARALELPLLGGDDSTHDWERLLTDWGLLASDLAIARAVHACGALLFLLSIAIAWMGCRSRSAV